MLHKALYLIIQSGLETSLCSIYTRLTHHIQDDTLQSWLEIATWCDRRVWRGLCSLPQPSYLLYATSRLLPQYKPEVRAGEHKLSYSRNPADSWYFSSRESYKLLSPKSFLAHKSKSQNGVFQSPSWSSLLEAHWKEHTLLQALHHHQLNFDCHALKFWQNPSAPTATNTKPTEHWLSAFGRQLQAHWTPWVGM